MEFRVCDLDDILTLLAAGPTAQRHLNGHCLSPLKRYKHMLHSVILTNFRLKQRKHSQEEISVVIVPEYLNIRGTEGDFERLVDPYS